MSVFCTSHDVKWKEENLAEQEYHWHSECFSWKKSDPSLPVGHCWWHSASPTRKSLYVTQAMYAVSSGEDSASAHQKEAAGKGLSADIARSS